MKVSDLLGSASTPGVRPILRDVDPASYDWEDATLWTYIGDGENEIRRLVPELGKNLDGTMQAPWGSPTSNNEDLFVGEEYRAALTHYVCARAFEETSGDERHAEEAKSHRAAFLAIMQPQE